jgi:hypothetical protein
MMAASDASNAVGWCECRRSSGSPAVVTLLAKSDCRQAAKGSCIKRTNCETRVLGWGI